MKTARFITIFILLCWLKTGVSLAQNVPDSTALYRVETKDGNEYVGSILFQDTERVRLKTENLGELNLLRINIKSITAVDPKSIKAGKVWFNNPQATRYLFAPNGYGLKKGEGYYQNVWVFVNQVSVGLSKNFSVGAGLVPLFLFSAPTPVWLLPKFSIPIKKDKFNLGAGALIGTVIDASGDTEEESGGNGFGVAYGIATFGSRDANVSLGLGYGYAAGEWASQPTITLSGLLRTGNRGYLITENYLLSAGEEKIGLVSLGGRRIIKSAGIDFGLIIPTSADIGSFIAIPFLGLTIPFGQQ